MELLAQFGHYARMISIDDIKNAYQTIHREVCQTPALRSETLEAPYAAEIFYKCENLQKTGAFKFRGASNAIAKLDDAARQKGVATHSSGNHGAALASAAQLKGIAATVVMPETAVASKIENVRRYGAEIVFCEPTQKSREETLAKVLEEKGQVAIHPYDNEHIIAGQGTVALEVLRYVPDLDYLLIPVGGGGLLAGCAAYARAAYPKLKIIGVEPAGADDAAQSLARGERVLDVVPDTIADGLRATIGELTFPLIKENVDDIITVSDEAIRKAQFEVMDKLKMIVEPSSAIVHAALDVLAPDIKGGRLALVLTGGNVDLKDWPWAAES